MSAGEPAVRVPGDSGRASRWVAAGILISRLSGLVRERMIAHFFGSSVYADVFRAGLKVPNLLQNLLGEGTLSASFIPVYAELLEKGRREEAGRVAGAILALLVMVAGGLGLLGALAAPWLVPLLVPGFDAEARALTVTVFRLLFPMTAVLVLSAWALGILNSHRRFFLSYLAPVFWNLAIIGAFVVGGAGMGWEAGQLTLAVAWGALIGGGLQLGVQVPTVLRLERSLRVRWDLRLKGVREAVRNAGPAIVGRGVVQISAFLDLVLASLLAVGAVAAIGYAQTLVMLPVSLFGMSVAAAELPELSRARGAGHEVLRQRIRAALVRVAFFVVPTMLAFLALGDVAVGALYQTGAFGLDERRLVHLVVAAYAVGLVATTVTRLFSSAFFALRDTATPARLAGLRVVLSAGLGFAFMTQLEPIPALGLEGGAWGHLTIGALGLGPVGLALGTGIAAWVEWSLLWRALAKKIGAVALPLQELGRIGLAALVATTAAGGAYLVLPELHPILEAVAVYGVFGAIYLALAYGMGLEEARRLLKRF